MKDTRVNQILALMDDARTIAADLYDELGSEHLTDRAVLWRARAQMNRTITTLTPLKEQP